MEMVCIRSRQLSVFGCDYNFLKQFANVTADIRENSSDVIKHLKFEFLPH